MASDLSELIQSGLSGTLESLLAKEAKLGETNKAHKADLKGQCVKVSTAFKFEKLDSSWNFFIPALSATYILNLMMGEDTEPSEEVNEDTLDALNEVVSNICGGLSTAINSSGFEDLGSVQFSLEGNEAVNGDEFSDTNNLFRFVILLEDKEIIFFIAFDDPIIPFIQTISSSEITKQPEEEIEPEEEEQLPKEDYQKDKQTDDTDEQIIEENEQSAEQEETKDEDPEKTTQENNNEEKDSKDANDTEEKPKKAFLKKFNFLKIDKTLSEEEQKQAKLKLIIIGVGALFIIVILTGIILYFTGAFEPTIIEKSKDANTTAIKKDKIVAIKSKPIKKYIDFKMSQINKKRLNRKLSLLTKYEILEDDAIEKLKAIEKERLYKERQAKLELFAKRNKEEPLFEKIAKDKNIIHKNNFKKDGINTINNKSDSKDTKKIIFDSFVQIPTLKFSKFSKFIKKAKKVRANLSICKDSNGRTQIFVGPFLDKISRTNTLKTLNKKLYKDIKQLNLSKKDFDKMCKF